MPSKKYSLKTEIIVIKRIKGTYTTVGSINYFIPYPLPPHNQSFVMDKEIIHLYGATMWQLGQLNGITKRLPNEKQFIKTYVIEDVLLPFSIEEIHNKYYIHLDSVRTQGDFEEWIKCYLTAIEQSSSDAYKRVKDIEILEQEIKHTITSHESFSKIQETANQALVVLFEYPVITATELSEHINKSYNTANNIITQFVNVGILVPHKSEQQRNKRYVFEIYLKVLENEY